MRVRDQVVAVLGTITLLAFHSPMAAGAEAGVGVRRIEVPSPERGRPLDVTIWYPAASGGSEVVLGDTPFFTGTPAQRDAPVAEGRFPLVLLSHGAGLAGQAEMMSWIAAPLAQRGFIVAAPTHPGNGGPKRSAAETMKLWLRPSDISRTLDAMERAEPFVQHQAPNRVGVLGLSMGGSTALALAGARFDARLLAAYCDGQTRNPSLCGWVRQSGVDLHAMDMRAAGQDYRDERIGFAMAIDPAPADIFDEASLPTISIPIALVNLGHAAEIPATAQASTIADSIPDADYAVIEDASHFSMFGTCKPGAAQVAVEEGIDDPICSDGAGRSRQGIHTRLVDMAEAAFRRELEVNAR
ncbi:MULTISPECIES: alpha/beta hydrolase family protein [unclassified Aureimonas]|uniref:alpha/beta hydrolase family protein n=1 Tax=unclassified Aureimonas TaxID=2615206 RepID=UPI000700E087|nr:MULTISPECIES: alpha/beta fold hydrolase [unclassified Aureimonas]KQT65858.1 dienelactone hydrolase [Aureimonas sp. Leaf427]KQT78077.1 dienelactone hydrolase [Aureimonas sp. Leaf460]